MGGNVGACEGDQILEALLRLSKSAKGLPRTQEALVDAFLTVFIAIGDDRRDGCCLAGDKPSPGRRPR